MRRTIHIALAVGVAASCSALGASGALAASGVHAPSHAQRTAILRALVKQDGSTAGLTAVYLANSDSRLAGACLHTPDAGRVAFLFRASARSWRYLLSAQSAHASVRAERTLERACLG